MKNFAYTKATALIAIPCAMLLAACGGGDDLTAENITVEECEELFGEGAEDVEGDYDDDGDTDEDDTAIEERCVELMADEESE